MDGGVKLNSLSSLSKSLEQPVSSKMDARMQKEDLGAKNQESSAKSFEKELESHSKPIAKEKPSQETKEAKDKVSVTNANSNLETKQHKAVATIESEAPAKTESFWMTEKQPSVQTSLVQGTQLKTNSDEPILKFLDSMEREVGIEADRSLAVFAQMPKEVLAMPIGQTQDAFIANLNVPIEQEIKAREVYSQFTADLSTRPEQTLEEGLAPMVTLGQQGTNTLVTKQWDFIPEKEMTPIDLKRQQIAERNAKLEALNSRFFDVYPEKVSADINSNGQMQAASPEAAVMLKHQSRLSPEKLDAMSTNFSVDTEVPSWIQSAQIDSSFSGQSDFGSESSADFMSGRDMATPDVMSEDLLTNTNDGLEGLAQTNTNTNTAKTSMSVNGTMLNENEMQVDGERVQMQDVVKKADVLIKNGGGEMKLQMSPDGLGEVHMKVAVKEGKVDVQILTEHQSTKKLIESEMQHLKAVLAEGKLDLREIKVDTAQDMRGQLEEQLADKQRENARQFLDFFRNNHGSARQAFNFANAKSSYSESQDPNEIAQKNKDYRRQRNENGRLSVVA